MQVFGDGQPFSPGVGAHTLCPPVWPERTQMDTHSVLAVPQNCRDVWVHPWPQKEASQDPPPFQGWDQASRLCQIRLCISVFLLYVVCVCVCSKRRCACQVCVLQLVLWIRPMTDTSYKPAISQHQGGTVPLPTRLRRRRCWGRWRLHMMLVPSTNVRSFRPSSGSL